jgi:FkbM family methyltransferase
MDFVTKILTEPKLISDLEVLKKIKSSELPLVLWGAAKMAMFNYRLLIKNGISVSAFLTDDSASNESLHGINIYSFEQIKEKFKKFNILVAHSNYELFGKYNNVNQVENIFTLFDCFDMGFSYKDEFLKTNSKQFNDLYNDLTDELSKDSLQAYFTSRATNNWEYIFPFICQCQYFPDFIELSDNEIMVDCGAYNGDTLLDFLNKSNGHYESYYALEPSPTNAVILEDIVNQNKLSNIYIVRKAAWDKKDHFSFTEDTDASHMNLVQSSNNSIFIETELIDNICFSQASFIKMDIEGAELMALKGAANTISSNKPKLAIAIYHKTDDLITIPTLIKELCPDYKFYFRLHNKLGSDAVLYAL